MKKHITTALILVVVALVTTGCGRTGGKVRISGTVSGLEPDEVVISPAGLAGSISDYRSTTIPLDADGAFAVTLPLEAPAYYRIGRNVLYLTPGDKLEAAIDGDGRKSIFKGRGAEANNYLAGMYYPQSGCFLLGGSNVGADFAATKEIADALCEERLAELESLTGVSQEFKRMERARLKADLMCSYLAYAGYKDGFLDGCGSMEEVIERLEEFSDSFSGQFAPVVAELSADDAFLDLPVVVEQLMFGLGKGYDFEPSQRLTEYLAIMEREDIFRRDITPEDYRKSAAFASGLANRDLADAFFHRLERKARLMPGRPAADIALTREDGTATRLSELKGKALYVDLWATWCAPCKAEAPHFAELSALYPDIAFVAISTDADVAAWKAHIATAPHSHVLGFHSLDPGITQDWDVASIPRFLLIDSGFNIVSANAPRPSQRDAILPLLDSLNHANRP